MVRHLWPAALAPLALFASEAFGNETASRVFRTASPSVVTIHAIDSGGSTVSQGSGVVISNSSVVSNCHVTERATRVEVGYKGQRFAASPRHADRVRDLCSFSVPGLDAPSAHFGSTEGLEVGQSVYAIGSPRGLELSLSNGILSSIRDVAGGRLLQTTAAISPGSSGGGLFDDSGQLVGITTLYFKDSQQLNFSVPVEWILELPSRHSTSVEEDREIEIAREQLNELEAELKSGDAQVYARLRERLILQLPQIMQSVPPRQWAEAARSYFHKLKSDDLAEARILESRIGSAREALNELGKELSAQDPETYRVVHPELVVAIKKLVESSPPEQWVDGARQEYSRLARDHQAINGRWHALHSSASSMARLDRASIVKRDRQITVWIRTDYTPPKPIADVPNVAFLLSRQVLDCESRTSSGRSSNFYDVGGRLILGEDYLATEPAGAPSPVMPGTVGEAALDFVCSGVLD